MTASQNIVENTVEICKPEEYHRILHRLPMLTRAVIMYDMDVSDMRRGVPVDYLGPFKHEAIGRGLGAYSLLHPQDIHAMMVAASINLKTRPKAEIMLSTITFSGLPHCGLDALVQQAVAQLDGLGQDGHQYQVMYSAQQGCVEIQGISHGKAQPPVPFCRVYVRKGNFTYERADDSHRTDLGPARYDFGMPHDGSCVELKAG